MLRFPLYFYLLWVQYCSEKLWSWTWDLGKLWKLPYPSFLSLFVFVFVNSVFYFLLFVHLDGGLKPGVAVQSTTHDNPNCSRGFCNVCLVELQYYIQQEGSTLIWLPLTSTALVSSSYTRKWIREFSCTFLGGRSFSVPLGHCPYGYKPIAVNPNHGKHYLWIHGCILLKMCLGSIFWCGELWTPF